MNRHLVEAITLGGVAALCSCVGTPLGRSPSEEPLRTAETFRWSGQPISFELPPEGWERQRDQSGGVEGVAFIKVGSVGEVVRVEEVFSVDKRDRCEELQALARDLDNMDPGTFERDVQRATLYAEPPWNREEPGLTNAANDRLDRARDLFRMGRRAEARDEILAALEVASRIRFDLDDVVERALYSAEGHPREVRVEVDEPAPFELAGESALRQDYRLHYNRRDYVGRRIYVAHNNRLFVIGFQGLEEHLALFERILDTVSFPPGACAH
jgi:hypothetical protein